AIGYTSVGRPATRTRRPAPMSCVSLWPALGPLLLFAMLLLGAGVARAGFPEVSELPSRPELPDPLVMLDGERVATKGQWVKKRRPELKALFQHYMYGYPPPAPKVEGKVEREDRGAFGGKATLKEVTVAFGPPGTPKIHLLLVVPNARKG